MRLIGRDTELGRLAVVVQGGGALLIIGDAGVGKTTVLETATADLPGGVLRARGRETETHLPFALLAGLLEPLRDRLPAVHPARANALAAALALAPPAPGDRFAVCAAATDLVALAASEAPLAVVVDDLHGADPESAECIAFLARRCPPGAAVLLASRPVEEAPWRDLPAMPLAPLHPADARVLLAAHAPGLPDPVAAQLLGAAAGNALALIELPRTLDHDQRTGRRPVPRPLSPGPGLREAFGRRVAALDDHARIAVLIAALGGPAMGPVTRACAGLGVTPQALVPAEAAGLLTLNAGRVEFRHPLIRGAVHDRASADERRRAHAALGAAKGPDGGAWHLAEAALGPDEDVAAALEGAGATAQARGGYATAADLLERAARLTPDPAAAARRLVAAGTAAFAAGLPARAGDLFGEVPAAADPAVRATAQHLGGLAALWGGVAGGVPQRIGPAAETLARLGAPHAPQVFADAATAAFATGDCRLIVALAQRGYALLERDADPALRAHLLAVLGWGLVLRGQRHRALTLLAELERLLHSVDRLSPSGVTVTWALNSRIATGEHARARAECLELAERGQATGALSAVPTALAAAADAERRMGEFACARTHALEAWALGHELGQLGPATQAGITLLQLAAAEGREEEARTGVDRLLGFGAAAGAGSMDFWGRAALGSLELGLGDAAAAVAALAPLPGIADRLGLMEPTICAQDPDLVEALWRLGRDPEARAAARRVALQADRGGGHLALAMAERCRGLLAPAGYDAHFTRALAHHTHSEDPFQRARTLLAHGMRLRRDRRRADARERLREARDVFERLGAVPWAAQAGGELRLAGGRRRAAADRDALSAQERRVAELVAGGATNREVAAALVVSHRTVEHHVAAVYRKLGVRSRTDLARAVAEGRLATAPG
ncbi:MAG: AAA family ATPase [Thermoleophilia bacterium]|nr:AAA family ATPase [Thermoleophilia bacterium]